MSDRLIARDDEDVSTEGTGILEAEGVEVTAAAKARLAEDAWNSRDPITDTWLCAYRAPFKAPEYCLGAIGWAKGFAEGAHRFEPADCPLGTGVNNRLSRVRRSRRGMP